MIVAKTPLAAGKWTKLIGSKLARKEYVALCVGRMKAKSGIIKDSVLQHGDEKSAVTHYQVEKEWIVPLSTPEAGEVPLSLIRLKLETGRMHQIRIHLAKNDCPIAGDDQHGNFKLNKLLKKNLGIKRLQLASVRLVLPLDGKDTVFEIPVPFDLQ
jgi:23S rRNA pseudouridine955/2504/2580 synthase